MMGIVNVGYWLIPCILASPVPVPGRASQGCSSESPTPPRCVSASPLSGKADYSTPPSKVTLFWCTEIWFSVWRSDCFFSGSVFTCIWSGIQVHKIGRQCATIQKKKIESVIFINLKKNETFLLKHNFFFCNSFTWIYWNVVLLLCYKGCTNGETARSSRSHARFYSWWRVLKSW